MFLPLNVAYQFFLSSSPDNQESNAEKGISDNSPNSDNSLGDSNGNGTGEGRGSSDEATDDDYLVQRDERDEDDDEIINELEEEEYPDGPRRRKHRRMPPRFKSLSSAKSYLSNKRPGAIWQKIKNVLSTETTSEEIEAFVPRYRYMPIISGVVIPFAILLEIPGLTEDWYIRTVANEVVEYKPNTIVLDVGLAFSMASAVLANVCLIARFMEKKIRTMTILCVIFLSIHDIINIITVIIFGIEHRFSDGFTYGQAYWITVCSTSVSTFVNITLLIDLIRTPDFTNSGSGLTRKQRTLVISVMILLAYIAFGALIQTFLVELSFINALYFTVCTIETIGFGDNVPRSAGAKVFTCFYAVFGILNLALTIGMTRETVIEGIEVGYRKRVRTARERRRQAHYERRVYSRWQAAVEWRLNKKQRPIWVRDRKGHAHSAFVMRIRTMWDNFKSHHPGSFLRPKNSEWFNYPRPHGMHLNLEGLTLPELEAAAMEAGVPLHTLLPPDFHPETPPEPDATFPNGGIQFPPLRPEDHDLPLTHARIGRMICMLGRFALAVQASAFSPAARRPTLPPPAIKIERSQSTKSVAEQYESMRSSMAKEEKRAFRTRLIIVWIVFFVFWTVGAGIFVATEGWSYGTAFYFCFIAFTTIGYGDFSPKSPAGQTIFVVWALMGVGTMTILISIVSEAYSSRYKEVFSGQFSSVIQRYRDRAKSEVPHRLQPPDTSKTLVGSPTAEQQPDTATTVVEGPRPTHRQQSVDELNRKVRSHLEAFPKEVLRQAKRFKEDVRYLTMDHDEGEEGEGKDVPDGLKQLIRDIAGVEKLGERIRNEILKDEDARNTLLAISIEQAIRNLINVAEQAIQAVQERDQLANPNSEENEPTAGTSGSESSPVNKFPSHSKTELSATSSDSST